MKWVVPENSLWYHLSASILHPLIQYSGCSQRDCFNRQMWLSHILMYFSSPLQVDELRIYCWPSKRGLSMKRCLSPTPVSPAASLLLHLLLFLPPISCSSLALLPVHWVNSYPFSPFNDHIFIFSICNNSWNIKKSITFRNEWMSQVEMSQPQIVTAS